MKEGDSIGVVHRHETSPVDELGRCHPECGCSARASFHATIKLQKGSSAGVLCNAESN